MIGIVILVILSLITGIALVLVENSFKEIKDNKEEEILKLLPNINCGGCGYVNCSNMASEVIKDKSVIYKCRPLKSKEEVIKEIDKILKG